jgi:hypothetical protein
MLDTLTLLEAPPIADNLFVEISKVWDQGVKLKSVEIASKLWEVALSSLEHSLEQLHLDGQLLAQLISEVKASLTKQTNNQRSI